MTLARQNITGVLRVTPLTVAYDIAPFAARYAALGFEKIETESDGCFGVKVGDSHMIFAATAHMAGQFRADTAQRLTGRTTPYIYVRSIAAAAARLPRDARVIDQAALPYGVTEAVVEHGGDCFILAEKRTNA